MKRKSMIFILIVMIISISVLLSGCDLYFRMKYQGRLTDFRENEVEKFDGNITGQDRVNISEKDDDVFREFQKISGSSRVNIVTKRGDILAIFKEKIGGNPEVNLHSERGIITVRFEEKISGTARVYIKSNNDIIFLNKKSWIKKFIKSNNLEIETKGQIYYKPHFKNRKYIR